MNKLKVVAIETLIAAFISGTIIWATVAANVKIPFVYQGF